MIVEQKNVIEKTQYQTWKEIALLRGLGFEHYRDEYGDVFTSKYPVKKIADCWIPSQDGTTLKRFEELAEDGPHNDRHCITAYKFSPDGIHENVIVFHSSSSESGQLYSPIALSSLAEWNEWFDGYIGSENDGGKARRKYDHYLQYNALKI